LAKDAKAFVPKLSIFSYLLVKRHYSQIMVSVKSFLAKQSDLEIDFVEFLLKRPYQISIHVEPPKWEG